MRAGKLKKHLRMDKLRMIRRMEMLEQKRILIDIHKMWKEVILQGVEKLKNYFLMARVHMSFSSPHLIHEIIWLDLRRKIITR